MSNNFNDGTHIVHPLPGAGANETPTRAPAPPPPAPGTHAGSLPGSSVQPSELQKAADAGLGSKGVKPGV